MFYVSDIHEEVSGEPDQDSFEEDSEETLQKEFNDVSNIKPRVSNLEEIARGVESVKGMVDQAFDVFDNIKIRVKSMTNEDKEKVSSSGPVERGKKFI